MPSILKKWTEYVFFTGGLSYANRSDEVKLNNMCRKAVAHAKKLAIQTIEPKNKLK